MRDEVEGKSVLIVDDAPENLRFLSTVLKRGGLIRRPVTTGKLALEAAVLDPPDLFLLDISLCRRCRVWTSVDGSNKTSD